MSLELLEWPAVLWTAVLLAAVGLSWIFMRVAKNDCAQCNGLPWINCGSCWPKGKG